MAVAKKSCSSRVTRRWSCALFQGYLLAVSFQHPESYHTMLARDYRHDTQLSAFPLVDDPGWTFRIVTVISLTTGTMFLMWLGDQITERGIGNGISLIITIGIVARLPAALAQAWKTFVPSAQTGSSQVNPAILVLMVAFLFIVIAGVIAVTQGVRKITVQYAKRVVGRKMYGGQTQYMPLESELCGRDADHFRLGPALVPHHHCQLGFQEQSDGQTNFGDAFDRLAALRGARGHDFLLQLFLGRDAVPARADRR